MKKAYLVLSVLFCLPYGAAVAQYKILHSFAGTDGAYPSSTLVLSGRTLFGAAFSGGAYDSGCIFSIDTTGNNYRDIHDFSRRNSNGANPGSLTLQISGNKLFGMTQFGGANDSGTVFSVDTNGANYKDIYDFQWANGSEPLAGVILQGGQLFGMTFLGGANGKGTVFSIDTNGTNFKKLLDFNGANGANPYGVVTVVRNKLYGMTSNGGASLYGNIFSLDSNGTNYTDLFDFNVTNGQYPNNLLTLSKGQFFGVAYGGGAGTLGDVFSIDTNGAGFKDLLDFMGASFPFGANPWGDVILNSGNVLYGMTALGGASDSGCIFSVDTDGTNYADIYDFSGPDGDAPLGDLTLAGPNMYGTTYIGGANHYGAIFRLRIPPPAGVNELAGSNSSAKVYPNPSNGVFYMSIRNEELGMNSTVEIYNELGEQIYSQKFNIQNSTLSINLSDQPAGIYMYRLLTDGGKLLGEGKLVIAK